MRTIEVSEHVRQLQKYRDEGAQLYWNPDYDLTFWASTGRGMMSSDFCIGWYQTFVDASGHDTLEGLRDDTVVTATIEIPDASSIPAIVINRGPGRPRERTEPVQRSTIDLPIALWQALDEARGEKSRRAFIDSAVREKLDRETERDMRKDTDQEA